MKISQSCTTGFVPCAISHVMLCMAVHLCARMFSQAEKRMLASANFKGIILQRLSFICAVMSDLGWYSTKLRVHGKN